MPKKLALNKDQFITLGFDNQDSDEIKNEIIILDGCVRNIPQYMNGQIYDCDKKLIARIKIEDIETANGLIYGLQVIINNLKQVQRENKFIKKTTKQEMLH